MEAQNSTLGDDLDFKIEIGENTDEPRVMDSMGSGSAKKSTASSESSGVKKSGKAPAELSDRQRKLVPRFLKGAAHPGYCMLHIGIKIAALLCYLILGLLIDDKTFCFLIVIILSAIDFWVVKNLTGR